MTSTSTYTCMRATEKRRGEIPMSNMDKCDGGEAIF
jgi:hypothetical protein